MQLVICEKPSVAADVSKALSATHKFEKVDWGYKSASMYVSSAAGHLVAALPPDKYDPAYKQWSYESLPILPERFMYQPRDERAGARLRQLAQLINSPEVTEVVNACDAGREGELIFKLIAQYAKIGTTKPVLRAWFSSMTPQAIQTAFASLKQDVEMLPLEYSARCREEADWMVGMNATRAATCTLGGGRQTLTLGRVQTPTLALIVERDIHIESFVSEDFHQVEATFVAPSGTYTGLWRSSKDTDASDRFDNVSDAEKVVAAAKSQGVGLIDSVDVRMEDVSPPRLFDLTDLQREANKRYGMTATRTLAAAQSCYETHKVLSYPRTDSRYLTADMAPNVPKLVARIRAASTEYEAAADAVLASCDPSGIIDDSKVSDHHALTPTDAQHDLSKLSEDERRVYDLVARRLLASLLPPQRIERTVVWTKVDSPQASLLFKSTGRREVELGWRLAWPEASQEKSRSKKTPQDEEDTPEESNQELPNVAQNERVKVADAKVKTGHTKPPARFSEASLLGVMATAGKLVDDDALAEAMRERGLGTPATRAAILEKLIEVDYMFRDGRQLRATDKGRGLILALGEHPLVKAELTGGWEQKLRQIERVKAPEALVAREDFKRAVREFTKEVCEGFKDATPERMLAGRRKLANCPMPGCSGTIVEGRKAWGCDTYKSKDDTGCGLVIWHDQGSTKVTEKQMLARLEDIRSGKTKPPTAAKDRQVLAKCPTADCGHDIVERERSWGCTSYKGPKDTGCGFTIWKTNSDKSEVTLEQAMGMIASGEGNGRPKAQEFAPCPRCSGSIVDRGKFYGCSSWQSPKKTGCGTSVWKVQNNQETPQDVVREQLEAMKGTTAPKKTAKKASRTTKKR